MPLRTAQRWVNRYRRFGLAGLNRAARADQGKRRRLSDELRHLAERLALQKPPRGPGAIYREVRRFAQTEGYDPPGYHTIYNLIRGLRGTSTVLPLDGAGSCNEAYNTGHWRVAKRPNQIWHAFHARVDLWVRRDDGRAAQPWVTIIIDDCSRAIAGFFFSLDSPSALLTALAVLSGIAVAPGTPAVASAIENVQTFTPARLAVLRREGRPVFVNMTAAWCVTCLVNERIAIGTPAVQQAFTAHHVAYLKGDWTRQDPEISAYLRANGRDGVPLYVYYPPHDGNPQVLPQILTENEVLAEVDKG